MSTDSVDEESTPKIKRKNGELKQQYKLETKLSPSHKKSPSDLKNFLNYFILEIYS